MITTELKEYTLDLLSLRLADITKTDKEYLYFGKLQLPKRLIAKHGREVQARINALTKLCEIFVIFNNELEIYNISKELLK